MKKPALIPILACSVYFVACTSSTDESTPANNSEVLHKTELASSIKPTGKYQIKSGKYTTKSKNEMMSMAMDNYTITYFDDYGNKELTENVTKMEMSGHTIETHNFSLIKEQIIYSWDADKKTGTKYSIKDLMNKNIDYEALGEDMKKQYNYKELGMETILGRECKKISVEISPGVGSVACIWKGITMRSETSVSGTQMITEVTDLQENVTIDGLKLEIPANITFTELKMPGK
ncbi:MAG: hypothetical protein H7X71_04490 [Chitinophagales bacterium]|nr:hypothetical protein [Chitinophagales bacterium]